MKYLTNTGITRFWNNIKSYVTSKIPTKVSELDNDLDFLTSVPDHDASKITSGTIDIARLPQGALERLSIVADESARFALTSSNVQVGDVVKQSDTDVMYMVVDESNLNNSAGYVEFTAGTATSVPWSGVTDKPSIPTKTSDLTNDSHVSITTSADTTSTDTLEQGGSFTVIDSVTRDTNGHVTTVNTKTLTLPDICEEQYLKMVDDPDELETLLEKDSIIPSDILNGWYKYYHATDMKTDPNVKLYKNAWRYNEQTNAIENPYDTWGLNALISPKKYDHYTLKVKVQAIESVSQYDRFGNKIDQSQDSFEIICAYMIDSHGHEHTLSLVRSGISNSDNNGIDGWDMNRFCMVYDDGHQVTYNVKDFKDSLNTYLEWDNPAHIQVQRNGSTLIISASEQNSDVMTASVTYEIPNYPGAQNKELNDNIGYMLSNPCQIGIGLRGQAGSFIIEEATGLYDLDDIYYTPEDHIYSYDTTEGEYVLTDRKVSDEVKNGTRVYNEETGKSYYYNNGRADVIGVSLPISDKKLGNESNRLKAVYSDTYYLGTTEFGDAVTHNASDFASANHTHGNITNDGKVGSTANKPLITTTDGEITTGSFGNTANTFCEGNDSRLSDARTPLSHNHSASEITSGTLDSARIPNLDASKITSGTIDIARLPAGALERLVTVADQTTRYALTTSNVQLGDTVKQTDTGVMYLVVDTGNLNNADGYMEYTAGTATSVPWSGVTGKPSDFNPGSHTHGNIENDGKLGTASRVVITDSNKAVDVSSVTSTELGYLSGVTSSLQTQINSKADDSSVVHTTGNESISGTKSFNSDLNLNYAVTDVDDIVDSIPGTGNSDDYVHLTGNETVNGVKSFPDGIVANVSGSCSRDGDGNTISSTYGKLAGTQTWTGDNTFNSDLNLNYINADVSDIVDSIPGLGTTEDYVHLTGSESVNGVKSFPDGIVANVSGNCTRDGDGNTISSTYGKLASNQTWSGENTTHNIKPEVNATYNLGNSSYRWASVYANNYYYGTTAFTDKFVTTDTAQTINGNKSFNYSNFLTVGGYRFRIRSSSQQKGTVPVAGVETNQWSGFQFVDKNDTVTAEIIHSYQTDGRTMFQINVFPNHATADKKGVIRYQISQDSTSRYLSTDSSFQPIGGSTHSIGAYNNRWLNIYADNYYMGTTSFTDKFVTTDTVQTITNSKTFTTAQYSKSAFRFVNDNYTSGTPSSDVFYQSLVWGGYVNNAYTSSASINTAIRANGYSDLSFRVYSQTSNDLSGVVAETNADASVIAFRPIVNSTHNLGSSSYKWKSVYADSYYYGTTAWGLDQANVWTGVNTFSHINRKFWSVEKGVLPAVNNDRYTYFLDKNGATLGYTQISYNSAGSLSYSVWLLNSYSNNQLDPTGSDKYAVTTLALKADGSRYFSVYADAIPNNTGWFNLGTSSNRWKSVYANSYYLGSTAFGNIVTHNISEFATASHSHSNSDITSLDASKITSGTIDIARLPQGALDRLITVANQTSRYALTSNDISLGDTVKQLDTGELFIVTDITNLNNANGYTIYTAGTVSRAYADEDGINIKTGYGKLAGTQTWSSTNTFTSTIICKDPSSTNTYGVGIYFSDYQNNRYGYIQPHTNNIVIGADNGNIQFNSSLVPYNNGALSIGASSYRWSGVYADSYYYGTTSFTDKFVTTDTVQFISGIKKFTSTTVETTPQSISITSNPANEIIGNSFRFEDNDRFWGQYVPVWSTDGSFRIELGISNWSTGGQQGYWFVANKISKDWSTFDFYTSHSNANLGTSTNKWKTINGLNPGALSGIDSSVSVAMDTTNWTYNGTWKTLNTASATGWGYILLYNCDANDFISIRYGGTNVNYPCINFRAFLDVNSVYYLCALFQVVKDQDCRIKILSSGTLLHALFYPCLGNV